MDKRKAKQPTMSRRKKSRLYQGNPDRLSDLPDALIIQILCLMEMEDVVKTSVLSKRWNQLWTQVDTITLNCRFVQSWTWAISYTIMKKNLNFLKRYISSVDNTLRRDFSRIRNFSLSGFEGLPYAQIFECDVVDKLIEYILELNVETLNLDYKGLISRTLPSLFQCSSLIQLALTQCQIDWPSLVNLPLLKSLSLNDIYLRDVRFVDILMGCPVLEILVLMKVVGTNAISVISQSLKKVKLVDITYDHTSVNHILEIRAPLLQELEISGNFMVSQCVIADLSCLVKASLMFSLCYPTFVGDNGYALNGFDSQGIVMVREFNLKWFRMVTKLLKSVCHAVDLLIGAELLQVLTLSALSYKPSPTFMCKHLTIVSPLWKYDIPGIVYLFQDMPHLETIFVNVSKTKITVDLEVLLASENKTLSVSLFSDKRGNLLHLKNVKIAYEWNPYAHCSPYCYGIDEIGYDFELVDYILKSCVALERLVLCSSRPCSNETSKTKCLKQYYAFQHVNQLSSRLLTRSSLSRNENVEWEVKEHEFALEYTFSSYT